MLTLAIPNRNGSAFLPETLRSLEANRPYVRWWLQDGCSDDASTEIAKAFATTGDHIEIEPDAGQADALNQAFAAMGGDLLGFINSDDLLVSGAARKICEFFAAHPEVDLIYGQVEWIDAAGQVTGIHSGRIDNLTEVLDLHGVWWADRQWVQPEVFFRRSLWEKVGPFNAAYHLAFDYDFWVRCFNAGARVMRVPAVLAQFRLHPAQKSRAAQRAAAELRRIARDHLGAAKIPRPVRKSLLCAIDYDQYHRGEPPYGADKPPFWRYLLTHPRALRLPSVRQRLRISARLAA